MSKLDTLIIDSAKVYGRKAHEGQKRKYSGGDYFEEHCIPVADLVWDHTGRADLTAAALLHDTIEDTDTTYLELEVYFGRPIAQLVWGMTQVSVPEDGNRATRKRKDRDFLAQQSGDVHTIKCADLICNTRDILSQDPEFAKVYIPEAEELCRVLTQGDVSLWTRLYNLLTDYRINPTLKGIDQ